MTSEILSKDEKKQLVLKLYFKERKSYRDIAHQLRISLRDISAIINEFTEGKKPRPEKSNTVKAFQLFKKKKSLVDVVEKLNLPPIEVEKIYSDYLKLQHRHEITLCYDQIKEYIPELIQYYNIVYKNNENSKEKDKIRAIIDNDQIIAIQEKKLIELDIETKKLSKFKAGLDADIDRMKPEYEYLLHQLTSYQKIYWQDLPPIESITIRIVILDIYLLRQFY